MIAEFFTGGVITIEHGIMLLGLGVAAFFLDRRLSRISQRLDMIEKRLDDR